MRGETPNVVPNAIARGLCAMALLCAARAFAYFGPFPFKASEKLIAWKRVYIEQDEMYKRGCTLVEDFTPNADGTGVMQVDFTDDFTILPTNAIAFWAGGSANVRILSKTTNALRVSGINAHVPQYGGIRFPGDNETYTVDRRFLPNAFGSSPDGTDGGAFIEFKDVPNNTNPMIPKYDMININEFEKLYLSLTWFDNISRKSENVRHVLIAKNGKERVCGETNPIFGVSIIYHEAHQDSLDKEETIPHEIGHCLGLLNKDGDFSYIDTSDHETNHECTDDCIMTYANKPNGIAEFGVYALLYGNSEDANDSLRKAEDK